MTKIETALTHSLGLTHPILLAPMGSAAGGKLAAAVTNVGGLGLIDSGYADAATVSRELLAAGNARHSGVWLRRGGWLQAGRPAPLLRVQARPGL
jgi:NAD(P)H-dependent flavin oxidoreductase YrpB (nitropropane dioxygenase family)